MSDKKIVDITQLNKSIEEEQKKNDLVYQGEDQNDDSINQSAADQKELEEIPRKEDGSIDIDKISLGKDDKGRHIVDDNIFDKYYRELPEGTSNKSKSYKAYNNGKLRILGSNPAEDIEIQRKGANTLNARLAQRRTFAEVIEEMLCSRTSKENVEEFKLREGATNLEMIIASAARQAGRGNVRAMDFIRDTIGQKPSENINAAITGLTDEDKAMLQNIQNRLSNK